MKILHILSSNHFSGAEKIATEIIQMFRNEHDMIYCSREGSIRREVEDQDIQFVSIDKFNIVELKRIIKKYNPDMIHAHDFKASVLSAFITNKHIISHIHQNPSWLKKLNIKSIIYAISSKKYNYILGVSPQIYDNYYFKYVIKNKFVSLPNFIDKRSIKKKADKTVNSLDLLFVGRLENVKNPLLFLEIVKEIKNSYPNINAGIIGEGSLITACKKYSVENNLTQNVYFYGYKRNPYPLIKSAKLLIVPSREEGFGLVAAESIVLNTPVITSGVGGLSEIVDNKCGSICEDLAGFTNEIEYLFNNESSLNKMERYCINCANKILDISDYKNKLQEIYNRIETL